MPKINKKTSTRLATGLKKFQRIVNAAISHDINEADTAAMVADMLSEIFGYEKYIEITSEYEIRSTYCDLAIKLDGAPKLLIEVKAIGIALKDIHVKQAVDYAVNLGLDWTVLTNANTWQFYRIKYGKPVESELICQFSIADLNPRSNDTLDSLYLISREGFKASALTEYYEQHKAVNRYTIAAVLQSEPVTKLVRRELRAAFNNIKIETEDIQRIINAYVLKRDVTEGEKAIEAKKKITTKRKPRKRKPTPSTTPVQVETDSINLPN